MPASRNPNSYSAEILGVGYTLLHATHTITLNFDTPQRAKRFRFLWYGFLRACENPSHNNTSPFTIEELRRLRRFQWRIEEDQGTKLLIQPHEETPMGILAAEVLAQMQAQVAEQEQQHPVRSAEDILNENPEVAEMYAQMAAFMAEQEGTHD